MRLDHHILVSEVIGQRKRVESGEAIEPGRKKAAKKKGSAKEFTLPLLAMMDPDEASFNLTFFTQLGSAEPLLPHHPKLVIIEQAMAKTLKIAENRLRTMGGVDPKYRQYLMKRMALRNGISYEEYSQVQFLECASAPVARLDWARSGLRGIVARFLGRTDGREEARDESAGGSGGRSEDGVDQRSQVDAEADAAQAAAMAVFEEQLARLRLKQQELRERITGARPHIVRENALERRASRRDLHQPTGESALSNAGGEAGEQSASTEPPPLPPRQGRRRRRRRRGQWGKSGVNT